MDMNSNMDLFEDKSFTENIRDLWLNVRWALKRTWSTNATLTAGLIGVTLIQSLTPAGLALTARGLINAVTTDLNTRTNDISILLLWLGLGLGLTLAETMSRVANKYLTLRLHDDLNLGITSDILTHAAGLDVGFFEDPRFQDIMERAQQNTAGHFQQFVTNILTSATGIVQVVTLAGILTVIEPLCALIIILVGFPYLFYQWRVAKMKYSKEHSRATKRRWTKYYVSQLTNHQNVAEVKLLNLAPLLINKFRLIMTQFRDQDRKLYLHNFTGSSIFSVLSTIAFYGIFYRVVVRALKGSLTIGDIAIYAGITSRLGRTVENLVFSITTAVEHALYISNLKEFLNIKHRISVTSDLAPSSSRGEIEVKNVSFTYPGSTQTILSNISLHMRPGETVALVGENGAGKTTLVKLIARLYDPTKGYIKLDGIDLRELSITYLHSQLSFVFQNFGRYEATAADNIAFGSWQNTRHDHERVKQIARLAGVHNMIKEMPQGYETLLGRMFGEYNLSGGEWQKIAIARAFARDTSLFILDEPTSSLDTRSEYKLFSRFRKLAKGRTAILISHRFSTVSMADRILVIDNGQIVEEGTHKELLSKRGHYSNLYRLHQRQMGTPLVK